MNTFLREVTIRFVRVRDDDDFAGAAHGEALIMINGPLQGGTAHCQRCRALRRYEVHTDDWDTAEIQSRMLTWFDGHTCEKVTA